MSSKRKVARLKRAARARYNIREQKKARLCVFRTPCHVYAQITIPELKGDRVLVCASTVEKAFRAENAANGLGNIKAAAEVGKLLAKRAVEAGIKMVAFDRSGFKYHGRVKALADAAREGGLEF